MKILHNFSLITGKSIAWLTLAMIIGSVINLAASWLFNISWIWLRESITWMHGANFLLAAAYTLNRQGHVRVDIFYSKMNQRKKALVDLIGTVFLLIPTAIFIAWASWPAFFLSWKVSEVSSEAGGLPAVYIVKSFLLIMPLLLILEAINQLLKSSSRFMHAATEKGEC